jgi:hypothetical protein
MKPLITLIFIIFLTITTRSQVEDSVFYFTYAQLIASRDSVSILKQILAQKDTVIIKQNKLIQADSIQLIHYSRIVDLQSKPAESESFFKWSGFWIGLNTSYGFDSIITKSTVLAKLEWEITAMARITINSKWELNGGAVIPFREKFKLKAGINYLIF